MAGRPGYSLRRRSCRGYPIWPRLGPYLHEDGREVPDFNKMYELYDPCTVMFFFRNKHIMIDLGTGNNNKINWPLEDKQEMIDIIETVYRGARKGRGLVVSPKDYSTKYRY
ncbi:thioredoxin-like protein 4A isoform X2 [Sabethes cyaneus]|uniref:thioredoxin-like protein 4A isoform X2 n=1 Tax=Sabethes cyaneus TaxID=53552 RepID=UPI00237EDFA9|nr:thioredoxin-like protein 4A isoform X2 [Sabethes cyaneus]